MSAMKRRGSGQVPLARVETNLEKRRRMTRPLNLGDDDDESSLEEITTTAAQMLPPSPTTCVSSVNVGGEVGTATFNVPDTPLSGRGFTSRNVTPTSDKNSPDASLQQDVNDYRLVVSMDSEALVLKAVVRTMLFHEIKFIDYDRDCVLSTCESTVAGYLIRHCNIAEGRQATWWKEAFPLARILITDHRNNTIKSIQKLYASWAAKRKLLQIVDSSAIGESVHVLQSDGEMFQYELTLSRRAGVIPYGHFLEHFAKALVGVKVWKGVGVGTKLSNVLTGRDETN